MARVGAYTVTGTRTGADNQDSCCVRVAATNVGEIAMVAVCDGVGGLQDGQVASGSVVHRFCQWFENDLSDYITLNTRSGVLDLTGIKKEWTTLLEKCNYVLYQQGVNTGAQMGTTFTGLIACKGVYLLCQVGDSRCYMIEPDEARLLSADQTLVAREVARGALSAEEAAFHPMRKVVLQAIGYASGISPEFSMGSYDAGCSFVVCSDGLSDQVGNADLWRIFAPIAAAEDSVLSEGCETAANLALSRGERDDITAVCLAMEAWSAARMGDSSSESSTRLFDSANDWDFLDDGNNATLLLQPTDEKSDAQGPSTGTAAEASTAGHLMGSPFSFDDDDEATQDSFEAGDE